MQNSRDVGANTLQETKELHPSNGLAPLHVRRSHLYLVAVRHDVRADTKRHPIGAKFTRVEENAKGSRPGLVKGLGTAVATPHPASSGSTNANIATLQPKE